MSAEGVRGSGLKEAFRLIRGNYIEREGVIGTFNASRRKKVIMVIKNHSLIKSRAYLIKQTLI